MSDANEKDLDSLRLTGPNGGHRKACGVCGEAFTITPSEAPRRKTCSRACGNIHKSKVFAGTGNPAYKGGWLTANGYRVIGSILEHRMVMENHLGRRLTRHETVHHIDGDKLNNDLSNLELIGLAEHIKKHWEEGHYANRRTANRKA